MTDLNDLFRRLRSRGSTPTAGLTHEAATTAIAERATTTTRSDVTAMFVEALELEGLKPKIDGDGDIVFQHGRFTLVLLRRSDDPEHLHIALPNFSELDSPKKRQRALVAADKVNRRMKVVKVHTGSGKSMWAVVDMFIASPEQVRPVLMRCIEVLSEAVYLFGASMIDDED